ncbi:hypothetical protein [Gordonia effusa]|uniref:hypothetical protein n=1 Tax=Gordonia effusa TaxID=263908 RepID=UPI00030B1372|nr:hypothetical protein [Gordonia effusa]
MRVTKSVGIFAAMVTVGATVTIVAPTAANAETSMGSCELSGAGPAPSCSYQLSDDDVVVRFRSAPSTTSTLTCRVEGIGAVRLSPGASGAVNARNLSSGFHRFDVACSTLRGGSGGVSRSGTISVYVRSEPIAPPTSTPTPTTTPTPPPATTTPPTTTTTTTTPPPTTTTPSTTTTPPTTTPTTTPVR